MRVSGTIDGRFEIEDLAGSGGMGEVYRARDVRSGAPVALKVLGEDATGQAERFVREAEVLSALNHPGIVRYIAHGKTDTGRAYLAMEWLEGEDLSHRLAREPLAPMDSVTLARRAAEALAEAHRRGLVHRDVKPSNLFLPGGDISRVKLLDFGIARAATGSGARVRALTRTGALVGTPGYMAPEQARGDREIDARADVFALGCVLFECLAGRTPFVGENLMAVLAKILLEDPPRISEIRPGIPSALDAIVARALAKDPARRQSDGAALALELEALDALEASLAQVPAPTSPGAVLTTGEQRYVSVVVAGAHNADVSRAGFADTLLPEQSAIGGSAIEEIAARGGARVEGLVDGSLVMVVSHASSPTDQAARAAYCALALRAELPGAPVVLATGRGLSNAKLPVGEVIDRAAGLLRLAAIPSARPGDSRAPVLLDDLTAGLLGERFEFTKSSRGLELWGEREAAPVARTLLGKRTPCVGREREIASLEATFEQCADEPVARVVLVTAAAGMGKSRLRDEFLRKVEAQGRGTRVLSARGEPISAGSAFGLLSQLLRHALDLAPGANTPAQREKITAEVSQRIPSSADAARVSAFLGEILGLPFPEDHSAALRAARRDPLLMGDQMTRAWEDFLRAECARQPVLLLLEDLHWGDLPTVKFVDTALRALPDAPLMVLALARPEVHQTFPGLWGDRDVQEVRLSPLTKKAGESLIRKVLGESATPELVARLLERAAGNAFYLEELIRAVAEGRGDSLPESVVAMVQSRLEGFEPEARRILRAASVFGERFSEGGVRALIAGERDAPDLSGWLSVLCEREVLALRPGERRGAGGAEYVFRHALVREAAYAMLTDHDRALGHRLAGAWLESAGEGDALALAEHFDRGGEAMRAVGFYLRAAQQALEGNDLSGAIARAQRGETLGAQGEILGSLRMVQAEASAWKGDFDRGEACALAARELFAEGSVEAYKVAGGLVLIGGNLGRPETIGAGVMALLATEPSDAAAGQYTGAATMALLLLAIGGRYGMVAPLLARIDHCASKVPEGDAAVHAWRNFAHARTAQMTHGDGWECLARATAAEQGFERAGDQRAKAWVRLEVGLALVMLGDYDRAAAHLRATADESRALGILNATGMALHYLAAVSLRRNELDAARALANESVELMRTRSPVWAAHARHYLARVMLAAGDAAGAEREALAAVEGLAAAPTLRVAALAALSRARAALGRPAEALEAAREAASTLDELGAVGESEGFVRWTLVEALRGNGAADEARAVLEKARERVRERAAWITDDAVRERFVNGVEENARVMGG